MASKAQDKGIGLLLRLMDEAYEKKAWHGPNLKGAIRGLSAQVAVARPANARHSIWEIVLHAAYWKYAVRRRLRQEKKGSFALSGSNWFSVPKEVSDREWKSAVSLLDREHLLLRETVKNFPARDLAHPLPKSKIDNARMIYGIASHDLYHAGQIQLLKRLIKRR